MSNWEYPRWLSNDLWRCAPPWRWLIIGVAATSALIALAVIAGLLVCPNRLIRAPLGIRILPSLVIPLLLLQPVLLRRGLRTFLRRLKECNCLICPDCGYLLRDLPEEYACPECGRKYTHRELADYWRVWINEIAPWK
jgi:hypothetical protein